VEKVVEDTRAKFYTVIIFIKIFLFRMNLIKIKAFYCLFHYPMKTNILNSS